MVFRAGLGDDRLLPELGRRLRACLRAAFLYLALARAALNQRWPIGLPKLIYRTAPARLAWPLTQSVRLALVITLAVGQNACAPPSATEAIHQATAGRELTPVSWHKGPARRTLTRKSIDYLQVMAPVGHYGGVLRLGQIGEGPKTFNPWASYDATSSEMGSRLVSGLMTTDPYTGKPTPALAKTVAIAADKQTYTITLRKGLQWSDGRPITSKDVLFTWNVILKRGLGNPSARDALLVDGEFPKVRAMDALTLEFVTPKPFAPFLRNLSQPIAPAHVFAPIVQKGGDAAFSAAWGSDLAVRAPETFVSSGPWLLERYDRVNGQVVFARNPLFWMLDSLAQPLPYLDRHTIRFVKDTNALELLFEQGRLDVYGVPSQYLARVRQLPKRHEFTLYNMGPASGTTFLIFNLTTAKDNGQPLVPPVKSRWFRDTAFRQAVDLALDREAMVRNILLGIGAPLFSPESPNSPFADATIAAGHPPDLDRARAILKNAGYSWNKQGQLMGPNGQRVRFTLMTNTGNEQREATGVAIQQDLARLGITVDFRPMAFNVLINRMGSGRWEALIMGLTGSILEPHEGINVWKSDGALHLFNQRRPDAQGRVSLADAFGWELELDRIFREAALSLELTERKRLYAEYQRIVAEQLPMLYLYSPLSIIAVSKDLHNVDPTPLEAVHNLEWLYFMPE